MRIRAFLLLTACLPCLVATGLDALRVTIIRMRERPPATAGPRGATPRLTQAKHQLRDWVEARLQALSGRGDASPLEGKLNAELRSAGLLDGEREAVPDQTLIGTLKPLRLYRSNGRLILQTGLGIDCGFDESAYLYEHSGKDWKRRWQTEQNTYTEGAYRPQTLHAVIVSTGADAAGGLILTLGTQPWCSSMWHHVYYRLFRLGPDPAAPPLLDGSEFAYLDGNPPILGSLNGNEALIEYRIASLDGGVHNRAAVRHYRIDGDKVRRIDPFALSPRDFVDEWLTHTWREAANRSESVHQSSLLKWHRKLHKGMVHGEFLFPTMHCPATPDLWQVGIALGDPKPRSLYCLLRWRPPYRFTMVEINDRPWSACTEKGREADDGQSTLFPPGRR